MIGYSTLYKSMNGIKILSDGVSIISNGDASHNNIVYSNYIYSSDAQTQITNNKVKTVNVECNNFTASTISATNISSNSDITKYLLVNDGGNLFEVNKTTNSIIANLPTTMNNILSLINYNFNQTQTGIINQSGTGTNNFKDTNINGFLNIGSTITQTGGSTVLKDLSCGAITMSVDKSITQTGNNYNSFGGTTTLKNAIITDSILLPSNVNMANITTTDDIIMTLDSVIIQDITTNTTNRNIFRDTKTLNLIVDGDITQTLAGATASLKALLVAGSSTLQGDITQTTGASVFKTIRCDNLTLNDDQNITQGGTGYITQNGTGTNNMKAINLLSNANIIFNGTGIISQPTNGINVLSHYRCTGMGVIQGQNTSGTSNNYKNLSSFNGIHIQYNRDNSTQYSFLMTNRATGGNGGFRFQRYISAVYLDEPLVIDDLITMNKNLSIPGGTLTCQSATIGNISQSELDCLDGLSQNINTKFSSLDSQISALQASSSSSTTALSGISYISGTDTTLIDNNLSLGGGKSLNTSTISNSGTITSSQITTSGFTSICNTNLTIDTNFINARKNINYFGTTALFYDLASGGSMTSIYRDNTSKNLYLDSYYYNNGVGGGIVMRLKNPNGTDNYSDVASFQPLAITFNQPTTIGTLTVSSNTTLNTLTVNSNTVCNNDLNIAINKRLYIGSMDVWQEITNLDTSFTTGTINTTNLTAGAITATTLSTSGTTSLYNNNLVVNNSSVVINQPLTATNITANNLTSTNINGTTITGTNINGTTTTTNNIITNSFKTITFTPPTISFVGSGGNTNVTTVIISNTPPNWGKGYKLNLAIAIDRLGFLYSSSIVTYTDTLSGISAALYKNDVFQNNINIDIDQPLSISKSYVVSGTGFYHFAQYFTNAVVYVNCNNSTTTDTYKVKLTFTSSYTRSVTGGTGDHSTDNFFYGNSDTGNTYSDAGNIQFLSASPTSDYIAPSYQEYSNPIISLLPSSNTNNLIVSDLQVTNLYSNMLRAKVLSCKYGTIPGYFGTGTSLIPLVCSSPNTTTLTGGSNNDNFFIINPGFRVIPYKDASYVGAYYSNNNLNYFDNVMGTTAIIKNNSSSPDYIDEINSIKIFWFDEELTIAGIS